VARAVRANRVRGGPTAAGHEFRKFVACRRSPSSVRSALDIHGRPRDLDLLGERLVTADRGRRGRPVAYQTTSAARTRIHGRKNLYVHPTAAGSATGASVTRHAPPRPRQDTGIRRLYPVGEGLLTFSSLEEAAAGVETIRHDTRATAGAGNRRRVFDSDKVLTRLLNSWASRDLGRGDERRHRRRRPGNKPPTRRRMERLSWVTGLRRLGCDVYFVETNRPEPTRKRGLRQSTTARSRLSTRSTSIGPIGHGMVRPSRTGRPRRCARRESVACRGRAARGRSVGGLARQPERASDVGTAARRPARKCTWTSTPDTRRFGTPTGTHSRDGHDDYSLWRGRSACQICVYPGRRPRTLSGAGRRAAVPSQMPARLTASPPTLRPRQPRPRMLRILRRHHRQGRRSDEAEPFRDRSEPIDVDRVDTRAGGRRLPHLRCASGSGRFCSTR